MSKSSAENDQIQLESESVIERKSQENALHNLDEIEIKTQLQDQAQTKLLITKETALNEVTESLKVKKVETAKLPTSIKEFYQFWQSPSFKDESGNVIEGQSDETRAAFKTAFTKKLDEDFEKITNYFSTKFTEAASLEVGSSSGQSENFDTTGIKGGGFFSKNLQTFTDNKDQLLSLLHDYSAYIALLAEGIEGANQENKKSQIEKTRQFLRQFPPLSREEYQCLGGSSSRLSNALSVLQNSSIILLAHESLVNKAVSDFSNKVALGNHVHIKPMLHYFLGIDHKTIIHIDYNYRTPIEDISAQTMWEFVSSYQEKLNEEVAAEIAKAKDSFERETKEQKQNSQLPSSKDYEALAQKLTADHGIRIVNQDLLDEETYSWKESADFEQLIKKKVKEQIQKLQAAESDMEVESQVASGSLANLNANYTDYFSTHLPSSTDITKPTTIKTIAQLAKDVDANKRQVAFSALRILGEELKDRNKNILHFLSILQEIGIEKNSEEKEIETNYENVLGIKRITNKAGGDEKCEVKPEDKKSQYLLSRIVDRCDRVLQDSGYHIGSVATGITSPNQQRQKDLLLFHSAITQGNQENTLKLITEHNNLINERNRFGETAIHIAAKYPESHPVLEILLANGADANGVTNNGWTPLHIAANNNYTELAKALLTKQELDVNRTERNDWSALHIASNMGNNEIVKALLTRQELDVNSSERNGWTAIHLAVQNNHIEIVKALIEKEGTNINKINNDNCTPLHLAAERGHIEVVKVLLTRQEVMIDQAEKNGWSALHFAAAEGYTKIVAMLIKKEGVNVNGVNENGWTALHMAAEKGHVEVTKVLLSTQGIDVNVSENNGITPLHIAAENGFIEVVKILLKEEGIDINKPDKYGRSALHSAVSNDHVEVVKVLSEAGIDINKPNKNSWTALHIAVNNGYIEVVKALFLIQKAEVNQVEKNGWTALHMAAEKGHLEISRYLLSIKGLEVNQVEKNGWTALHIAVQKGYTEIVKSLLLKKELNVNQVQKNGWSALHIAAEKGYIEIVKILLLKQGIDVNRSKDKNLTPLHVAAKKGHKEVVRALLSEQKLDVNKVEKNGWTALHISAKEGQVEVTKVLLSTQRLDVNRSENNGITPLHIAAENGFIEVVKILLKEEGIDINKSDKYGRSALHFAVSNGHVEVTKVLLSTQGIDVNVSENNGITPLHIAAENGFIEVVKILLKEEGIDINKPDKYGRSALQISAEVGNSEVLKILIENGAKFRLSNEAFLPSSLGIVPIKKEIKDALFQYQSVEKSILGEDVEKSYFFPGLLSGLLNFLPTAVLPSNYRNKKYNRILSSIDALSVFIENYSAEENPLNPKHFILKDEKDREIIKVPLAKKGAEALLQKSLTKLAGLRKASLGDKDFLLRTNVKNSTSHKKNVERDDMFANTKLESSNSPNSNIEPYFFTRLQRFLERGK